jgi:ADP-ribosylglycohydrolase
MRTTKPSLDSLTGLAVGDALGAIHEGRPFAGGSRPALTPPPGVRPRWTDDTQMALSVLDVLLKCGEIEQDRLARAFAARYESWRGYGAGMHVLLSRLNAGDDWRSARFVVFPEGSFGNGSAMRVAPLGAFLARQTPEDVVEQAARSAEVTHAHPEGVNGATAVALAAWHVTTSRGGPAPPPADLIEAVRSWLPAGSDVARGLRSARELAPDAPLEIAVRLLGNGSRLSCADTVPLALWISASHLDDYRTAVETAVAAGGDTDTMAAIVGGIVAARVSAAGIPAEWRDAVEPLPIVGG